MLPKTEPRRVHTILVERDGLIYMGWRHHDKDFYRTVVLKKDANGPNRHQYVKCINTSAAPTF